MHVLLPVGRSRQLEPLLGEGSSALAVVPHHGVAVVSSHPRNLLQTLPLDRAAHGFTRLHVEACKVRAGCVRVCESVCVQVISTGVLLTRVQLTSLQKCVCVCVVRVCLRTCVRVRIVS